jgi:hypothetical protein
MVFNFHFIFQEIKYPKLKIIQISNKNFEENNFQIFGGKNDYMYIRNVFLF